MRTQFSYRRLWFEFTCKLICFRPASPPDEFKPLIERLLTYVKKDGEAFEKQVLQRNDPRFSFLQPGDANFEYYKWRKEQIILAKLQVYNSPPSSP